MVTKSLNDFSPQLRLSHYFSQVLLPDVVKENSEIVQMFRRYREVAAPRRSAPPRST